MAQKHLKSTAILAKYCYPLQNFPLLIGQIIVSRIPSCIISLDDIWQYQLHLAQLSAFFRLVERYFALNVPICQMRCSPRYFSSSATRILTNKLFHWLIYCIFPLQSISIAVRLRITCNRSRS